MATINFKDYYGDECVFKLEDIYDVYTEKNNKGDTCYYVEYFENVENGYRKNIKVNKKTYLDIWSKAYDNHLI